MKLALRLAAARAEVAASVARAGWARTGVGFAKCFRPVRRARALAALIVAALAVAILRRGAMARIATGAVRVTLAVVPLFAALAVCSAIGLGRVTMTALRTLDHLRRWLQALEGLGRLDEAGG